MRMTHGREWRGFFSVNVEKCHLPRGGAAHIAVWMLAFTPIHLGGAVDCIHPGPRMYHNPGEAGQARA